jgi:hypothetical protein
MVFSRGLAYRVMKGDRCVQPFGGLPVGFAIDVCVEIRSDCNRRVAHVFGGGLETVARKGLWVRVPRPPLSLSSGTAPCGCPFAEEQGISIDALSLLERASLPAV